MSGASNGGGAYRSSGQPYPKMQSHFQHQSSSYQPPAPTCMNTNNNTSSNASLGPNPYQASEEAFLALSSSLLQKHAAYNYPPNDILYNHMSDADRRNFVQGYHHYLSREEVTTYGEVGERPIVQILRDVRKVFGPTLDGMTGGKTSTAHPSSYSSSTLENPPSTYVYGAGQPHQPQQQQQPDYSAQNGDNAHYDMRDDVNTVADDRSVHTSAGASRTAPSRAYPSASQSRARGHHDDEHVYHHQQQRFQKYEEYGRDRQRRGRWTVPAASRKKNGTGVSSSGSGHADIGKSLVMGGQYVNMNRQYDNATPYGTGGMAQKETELTTRSRSAPERKSGIGSRDILGLRPTMSLEECKGIRTKSQARQHLMEEMNHSQELLGRATNANDRMLYKRHMEQLRKELQELTDADDKSRRGSLARHQLPLSPSASLGDCASITSRGKKALGEYVNVVAPGNLPENYQFEAKVGRDTFTATVPRGGVSEGQMFTSQVGGAGILKGIFAAKDNDVATVVCEDDDDDIATIATYEKPLRKEYSKMDIPRGRWRDGLMDGLFEGPLHPLFWHSWFCPTIALAQIMARLRIVGPHKTKGFLLKSKLDLTTTVLLTFLFYFVNIMVVYVLFGRGYLLGKAPSTSLLISCGIPVLLIDAAVVGLFYFSLIKTRKIIRESYEIEEGNQCPGHEDALVSIFCTSCAVSQMGRHTADFSTYRGHCCTETGLPDHVACDV